MSEIEIKVPNIGEFKNVEVIEVLVSEGQTLKKNDPLITIESDKSSVEIPSNFDGKIKTLKIKIGDKVSEGDLILILESINDTLEKVEKKPAIEKEIKKPFETKSESQKIPTKQNKVSNISSASPKVRKFARELGVDINQVAGSERKGRVIESDVKLFVASSKTNNFANNEIKNNEKIKQEFTHSEFGEVEIKDIPRIKKLSSKYLINSWTNIPHVTNHDEADITELEDFRTSLTDIYTGEKKKITPLAFIVKALTASLKKFPNFNSSIDDIDDGKMTVKKYYHIGIAVDTPHGLMVPKLRNADNKNINIISTELKNLSAQCRNLKIDKKELFGGSMTITSLGGIGGSFFTPIINFPEVAILGIGRSEKKTSFLRWKIRYKNYVTIIIVLRS